MTLCEYFRKQFINEIRNGRDKNWIIKSNYYNFENGSFEFLKACTKYNSFGSDWHHNIYNAGITLEQINNALDKGYIKIKHYDNWQARQLGTTCLISLTIKGLKALYKSYDNWQV